MRTITIGIDLAKQVFSACAMDSVGRVRQRKDFRRDAFCGVVAAGARWHAGDDGSVQWCAPLGAAMFGLRPAAAADRSPVRDPVSQAPDHQKLEERCARVQKMIGIGPLTADALIEPLDTGDARVHLKDGIVLPCSRRQRDALRGRVGVPAWRPTMCWLVEFAPLTGTVLLR